MEVYTLFSGSSGNCVYIREGATQILVDAGVSSKRINNALADLGSSISQINAIYITHEHSDHTKALEIIEKYYDIPIFLSLPTAKALCPDPAQSRLAQRIRTVEADSTYGIGDFCITPFLTPHDAAESLGFRIESDKTEQICGIATDVGYVSDSVYKGLSGCSAMIIESNHDLQMLENGPYPEYLKKRVRSKHGHLSNDDCAKAITSFACSGTEKFCLFHLSDENNEPSLAEKCSRNSLMECGVSDKDCQLFAAPRNEIKRVV